MVDQGLQERRTLALPRTIQTQAAQFNHISGPAQIAIERKAARARRLPDQKVCCRIGQIQRQRCIILVRQVGRDVGSLRQ